ncbi:MAG: hypothetical protein RLZZ214_2425 [Verrucomicrobiota bacterium]
MPRQRWCATAGSASERGGNAQQVGLHRRGRRRKRRERVANVSRNVFPWLKSFSSLSLVPPVVEPYLNEGGRDEKWRAKEGRNVPAWADLSRSFGLLPRRCGPTLRFIFLPNPKFKIQNYLFHRFSSIGALIPCAYQRSGMITRWSGLSPSQAAHHE